jgi:hypothetical protein
MSGLDDYKNYRFAASIQENDQRIMAEARKRALESDIDDLQGELRGLERSRDDFFDESDEPHNYGDQGYQDIVNRIDEIEEQIKGLRNES